MRSSLYAIVVALPTAWALRILCFGDSLTAGLVTRDQYVPYGEQLRRRIGADTAVTSSGVVMESVHKMPARLRRVLQESAQPFDAIIVLGGSNDLWTGNADAIWRSLQALHCEARAHGAALGVATMPPFEPAPMKWLERWTGCLTLTEDTRSDVNARIRTEAAASSSETFLVDLAALCDASAAAGPLARPDGMHLDASGYEALGDLAAAAIASFDASNSETSHSQT